MSTKPEEEKPREYVVINHGKTINMYSKEVWENEHFRTLIGGKKIGGGLTFEEAVAIRKLMESGS